MNVADTHLLIMAIITITFALFFYTIGVWGEHVQKRLKKWHILFFLLGLLFDFIGTSLMAHLVALTGRHNELHLITGVIAIGLMFIHAFWAIYTYYRGSLYVKRNFSKFSLLVWTIWLIPYFTGVIMGVVLHQ